MIYAFTDGRDGYYQVELREGEPMPEWTQGLTPTEVRPPVQTPIPVAQQIAELERQSGMVKAVRKFMLTAMETEAIKQGATQGLTAQQSLALLTAKNAGYAGVKALDTQIEALEARL